MQTDELTDLICKQSEKIFDPQTVRNKCKEYVKNGILLQEKQGKAITYKINPQNIKMTADLLDAICFFQGSVPFGEAGSYILDNERVYNDIFVFKHQYIAHTLENMILFDILSAIRQSRAVTFESQSERTGRTAKITALPLKIFVSSATGRRYYCMYSFKRHKFYNYRLDYIKKVALSGIESSAPELKQKLNKNLDKLWGISFGSEKGPRSETVCIRLCINEKSEQYIIDRIKREGMGGELIKLGDNMFMYTKEVFDSTDMSPWIKTFIGRVTAPEGTNECIINRFHDDINRMAEMYDIINTKRLLSD